MGTAEKRLEILKYLCRFIKATMLELAEKFGVSIKTIRRDISHIETIFHVPIDIRCSKYSGGIYVLGDYSFDREYMHNDELALLSKVQSLVKARLTNEENAILSQIIKAYTKTA